MEDKHSEAATQCVLCKRCKLVCLNFSQNWQENNCVGVLSCRPETSNFIKKETPTQVFFCTFCEIFKITTPPLAAFETFYSLILTMKHKLSLEFFLSEKKIRETSVNNQIYSFFKTYSCWTSIFDITCECKPVWFF